MVTRTEQQQLLQLKYQKIVRFMIEFPGKKKKEMEKMVLRITLALDTRAKSRVKKKEL